MARTPKSPADHRSSTDSDPVPLRVSQASLKNAGAQPGPAATKLPMDARGLLPASFRERYRPIIRSLAILYFFWLIYLAWVAYMVLSA